MTYSKVWMNSDEEIMNGCFKVPSRKMNDLYFLISNVPKLVYCRTTRFYFKDRRETSPRIFPTKLTGMCSVPCVSQQYFQRKNERTIIYFFLRQSHIPHCSEWLWQIYSYFTEQWSFDPCYSMLIWKQLKECGGKRSPELRVEIWHLKLLLLEKKEDNGSKLCLTMTCRILIFNYQ